MSQRHPIQNDAPMLITTNVRNRERIFYDDAFARTAIEAIYSTQEINPFFLYGFVIMPDHCHLLLRVPSPGTVSQLMNAYKRKVSFEVGRPLWQPRFHIRIPNNPQAALQYIHMNPVRADIVKISTTYPWSSASGRWDVSAFDR